MAATMSTRRFVLEAIDPATECPAVEVSFEVEDIDDLRAIVDPQATFEDFENGYDLNREETDQISKRFGIKFDPGSFLVTLRTARKTDELPYKVHTNRELAMMLAGTKPFAYFADSYPASPHFKLPEHLFAPYVTEGRFIKREYVIPRERQITPYGEVRGTRMVLYALKHEEWRIEAFILLQKTAEKVGWTEGFERMLGSLLGYEEWQNDAFIEYATRWGVLKTK
jgi:hypothetical protein